MVRTQLISVWVVSVVLAACGGSGSRPPGDNSVLRATVGVEYQGDEVFLQFKPGPIVYDARPLGSHEVTFDIWTDDYIQQLDLFDHYVVTGSELVPADGASSTRYILSDAEPSEGTFTVDLGATYPGEYRVELTVPIHLVPQPRNEDVLDPQDLNQTIELVYDVFWAETPLDFWCAQADQELTGEFSDTFSPENFVQTGEEVLTEEQLVEFEDAADAYWEKVRTDLHWDPNWFFDEVEDICGVSYPERWQAMA